MSRESGRLKRRTAGGTRQMLTGGGEHHTGKGVCSIKKLFIPSRTAKEGAQLEERRKRGKTWGGNQFCLSNKSTKKRLLTLEEPLAALGVERRCKNKPRPNP